MKLSVVIPCLNGAATLANQLEALSHQDYEGPWEVIISDNGSTDESITIAKRYRDRLPNLRIVDASDRKGQPHALNVGAQAARGEFLAFCDADDEVAAGWLAAIVKEIEKSDFVVGRFDFEKLNPPWLKVSHAQLHGLNQYRYPPFLPHGGSGNMGVKHSLHDAVGGFDETMPYLFDTDYCFKVQLSGKPLRFVPDAVMHIRTMQTYHDTCRKARSNGQYNVFLYKRYRPLGMPKLSLREGFKGWVAVMRSLPGIRTKSSLQGWLWAFNWRMGRLKGCLKYRVIAL